MGRKMLGVIVVPLVLLLLISGRPFGIFFEIDLVATAIFRITVGLFLMWRYYRSIPALPLVFGYKTTSAKFGYWSYILPFIIFFSFLLTIGLFTDVVSISLLLLIISFNLKSKYFSIEDIYIQNTILHLPFLGSASSLSLDSLFMGSSIMASDLMFNSLFISNAIIMFSAGLEKIHSRLWRSGQGAYNFLKLPHLVKSQFHWIHKRFQKPLIFSGYLIMFAEFLLLFAIFEKHLLIAVFIVLIGFSISLYVILDISFIGQFLGVNLALFAVVLISNWDSFNSKLSLPTEIDFDIFMLISVLINLMSLWAVLLGGSFVTVVQKLLTGVVGPIAVFNEKHQFGIYTYKICQETPSGSKQILETFTNQGFPGRYQLFYPRYFQGAMYPVTDYCLGQIKYGAGSDFKLDQMIDLLYGALRTTDKVEGIVKLYVKPIESGESIQDYEKRNWTKIGQCNFVKDEYHWDYLESPPKVTQTFRLV